MRDSIKLFYLVTFILLFSLSSVFAAFTVSDQTPKEFTTITAACDFTIPGVPSAAILINESTGERECSLINWEGFTANFECEAGAAGEKNTRCTIDKTRSYQEGEDSLLSLVVCDATHWDIDDLLENGCEYICTATNDGIEICDNLDNDCNGEIDDGFTDENCQHVCEANGFTWTGNSGSLNCCGNDPIGYEPLEANPYETIEITCNDEKDNDCNGVADWNDPACTSLCNNNAENDYFIPGIIGDCDQCNLEGDQDNDQLGLDSSIADKCDSDCVNLITHVKGETITADTYEETEITCDDNKDNDCDGLLDCEDSDCVGKIKDNKKCCQIEQDCDGVDACHSCSNYQCEYETGEQTGCNFCAECDGLGNCISDLTQDTGKEMIGDCDLNDLIAINQCNYNPDNKDNTKDKHPAVFSQCSDKETCTSTSYTSWTHYCDLTCGAECESGNTREVETYYCNGQTIVKQKDGCNLATCLFEDALEADIIVMTCAGTGEDNICVNGQSNCNQCDLDGDQDGDGIIDVNDAHCGGLDQSCNGIDDDGDLINDDDYVSIPCGQGDCSGMTVCVNGQIQCKDAGITQANTDCGICCKCSSNIANPVEIYDETQDNDCAAQNLPEIATCDNSPDDNIHATYDEHLAVQSVCSAIDTCTQPSYDDVTNTCDKTTCNAQCVENELNLLSTYYCSGNNIMQYVENCDTTDCLFKDQTTDDDLLKTTCGTTENNICTIGQSNCNQCDLTGDQDNDQNGWNSIDADRCDSDCGTVAVTVQQENYYAENTQAACTDNIDNDCDGNVDIYDDECSFTLVIIPNPTEPNQQVTFSLLENYYTSGIVEIYTEPCDSTTNLQCSFTLPTQSCSIISPLTPDIYTYYACAGIQTNQDDEDLSVQAQGHCSSQETHSEGDEFTPAQYLHEYTTTWKTTDCDYLYDTSSCHCAVSNQQLNHVCDDWQCQGEAGLASCTDSGIDWVFESWNCDESSIYCSAQTCKGNNYYCYRTNEQTFTWKKTNDFVNGETNCNDGYDNDCDNTFDNNQGINSDSDCCPHTEPTETICDGVDSNCDGIPDENFVGDNCQERCTALTYVWKGNNNNANCCGDDNWEISTGEDQIIEELCDGLDNDCDGNIDEGCGLLCNIKPNCDAGEVDLMHLSSLTGGYAELTGSYTNKVCCRAPGILTDTCGTEILRLSDVTNAYAEKATYISSSTVDLATGGTASASSVYPNAGSYAASKAFDDNTETFWAALSWTDDNPAFIKYELPNTKIAGSYTILGRSGYPHRTPKDWTFQASNDNNIWTTLDTQNSVIFANNEKKEFTISNNNAYKYYRLVITDVGDSGGHCQIAEIEIYEKGQYPESVCLSIEGQVITYDYLADCTNYDTCIVSLSPGDTELTVGDCNAYQTKVCCKLSECECSGTECHPDNNGQICDGCSYVNAPTEDCAVAGDEDCDGKSDCADPGCEGQTCATGKVCISGSCEIPCECSGTSCEPGNTGRVCDGCNYVTAPAENCAVTGDDDCDGLADCGDPDCGNVYPCCTDPCIFKNLGRGIYGYPVIYKIGTTIYAQHTQRVCNEMGYKTISNIDSYYCAGSGGNPCYYSYFDTSTWQWLNSYCTDCWFVSQVTCSNKVTNFDVDGDGYLTKIYTTSGTDCNDNLASVHPGASPSCNNYPDDDCDGSQTDENSYDIADPNIWRIESTDRIYYTGENCQGTGYTQSASINTWDKNCGHVVDSVTGVNYIPLSYTGKCISSYTLGSAQLVSTMSIKDGTSCYNDPRDLMVYFSFTATVISC